MGIEYLEMAKRSSELVRKGGAFHREAGNPAPNVDFWDLVAADLDDSARKAEVNKDNRIVLPELNIELPRETVLVANLGDLHWGSDRTAHGLIKADLEFAKDVGAYVNLLGDQGQGYNPELSADTVDASLVDGPDLQLRKIFRAIAHLKQDRRLLALLGSREHERWVLKRSGIDPYNRMHLGGIMLSERGRERLHYPDGRVEVVALAHKPGGGGSVDNPLAPVDRLAAENNANYAQTAHCHSRAGSGIKVTLEGELRALGAGGSYLGREEGYDDTLLLDNGVRPAPPGVWTVHSRELRVNPFNDKRPAHNFYDGVRIWEAAEKNGLTQELLGEIWEAQGEDSKRISMRTKGSDASRRSSSLHDEDTPHWNRLSFDVSGTLPLQVYWPAGLRAGHRTAQYPEFKQILETASEHRRSYLYGGRLMVDRRTADDIYRRRVLGTMADAATGEFRGSRYKLTGVLDDKAEDPRWIGFLRDGALLRSKWNKDARDDGGITSAPFDAAHFIQNRLHVPLMDNKGVLVFNFSERANPADKKRAVRVFDNMEQSSGRRVAYKGTVAMVVNDVLDGNRLCDVYVGNTMPGAGVYTLYQQEAGRFFDHVNPGNLGEWQRGSSRTNNQPAVENGQSTIFDPVTGDVYHGATLWHSRDSFRALTLRSGAESVLSDRDLKKFMRRLGIRENTYYSIARNLLNHRQP